MRLASQFAVLRTVVRLIPLLALVAAGVAPVRADETQHAQWIFSPDGRTQVVDSTAAPYRSVVYLQTPLPNRPGYVATCTGAFIGPTVVLTAAHCLYSASDF